MQQKPRYEMLTETTNTGKRSVQPVQRNLQKTLQKENKDSGAKQVLPPDPNKETGENHINAKIEHTAAFVYPAAKL
jgi:hypothetical protein